MKVLKIAFALSIFVALLAGCRLPPTDEHQALSSEQFNPPDSAFPWAEEHMITALLYMQTSAEYKAICYQSYNLARLAIDQDILLHPGLAKRAVVFDIDETVLDNSPYEAACVKGGFTYPTCWDTWINKAEAKPVPGAKEFIDYLHSKRVEVFYITNRREKFREATRLNLEKVGLGKVADDHLLMRSDLNSKESRRAQVAAEYHISLLVGDNLADFIELFDNTGVEERSLLVDSLQREFGSKFIILPNPIYGDWESALYEAGDTIFQKERIARFNALTPTSCD